MFQFPEIVTIPFWTKENAQFVVGTVMRASNNETLAEFNRSINAAEDWVGIFFELMPDIPGERYLVEFYAEVCEGYRTDNFTVFESLTPENAYYKRGYADSATSVYFVIDVHDVWEYAKVKLMLVYSNSNIGTKIVSRTDPWTQQIANFTGLTAGYVYRAIISVSSYGKDSSNVLSEVFLPVENAVPIFSESFFEQLRYF